jgi:hypothetical protein
LAQAGNGVGLMHRRRGLAGPTGSIYALEIQFAHHAFRMKKRPPARQSRRATLRYRQMIGLLNPAGRPLPQALEILSLLIRRVPKGLPPFYGLFISAGMRGLITGKY